jgi:hypothetical protein
MSRRPRATDDRRRSSENDAPVRSDTEARENYRVGPGRPPKEFQWKPGQSGNPAGRTRKTPSIAPDLKAVLERALSKKVTLRQGEREQTVTLLTAGIEQLAAQFAKGDRHARRDLLDLAQKLGIDLKARVERALETDFAAEDEALLADYLKRHGATAVAPNRRSSALRNGRQDEEKEK